MLCGEREKTGSSDGDDPLRVIITNEEKEELWAGENTQA